MENKFLKLISEGKTEQALKEMGELLKGLDAEYINWIQVNGNFNELSKRNEQTLISTEQYEVESNRLRVAIIELANRVQHAVTDSFFQNQSFEISRQGFRERLEYKLRDKYQILEKIGEGGTSIYFKARKISSDRLYSIKALKSLNLVHDPQLRDEIDLIMKIKHRNVLKIFTDKYFNDYPKCVVMEYIRGVDLERVVRKSGPRTPFGVKHLLQRIGDAMDYLHKRNILKIDLQASKIMLDEEGEPMISPFIFFKLDYDKSLRKTIEECRYLSPEVLASKPETPLIDPRSIQFNMGALAYFLLTGKNLFQANALVAIIHQRDKYQEEEAFREALLGQMTGPIALTTIIRKLLSPSIEDRFESMQEFLSALNEVKIDSDPDSELVRESFQRALALHPGFINTFYKTLMEKLPEAKLRIQDAGIDVNQLSIMLQHAVTVMVNADADSNNIGKINLIQGHQGLTPDHYQIFLEAFVDTLKTHDQGWNATIEAAWDTVIARALKGLEKHT